MGLGGAKMFYRHWKKIALALTGFFWASCDDSSSEAVCLYGPDPNGVFGPPSEDISSESGAAVSSSSEKSSAESSEAKAASSATKKTSPDSSSSKKSGLDSLVSDSIGMVVALYGVPSDFKMLTLCFNDVAENDVGKEFKIIDCTDGNRYLRNPYDAAGEGVVLPEGVEALAPEAGSDKAKNCEAGQDICIERNPNIDPDPWAGCFPTINCPEKPMEDD